MSMKKGRPSINRRDFLNLSMYAGIGLIYAQLPKNLTVNYFIGELNITTEELSIIRDFPHPTDPFLTRIIDDSNVITEDEINDLIEPRLVNLNDFNEYVTPHGFPLLNEDTQAHELCVFDLAEMLDDSYKENLTLYIASGYRDYYAQEMALEKANGNMKGFQAEMAVYRECLRVSVESETATKGNKAAVGNAHDYTVDMEERIVEQFNMALCGYKQREGMELTETCKQRLGLIE